jgi:hypothetical protein
MRGKWSDLLEIPAAPKDDYEMEAELKAHGVQAGRGIKFTPVYD